MPRNVLPIRYSEPATAAIWDKQPMPTPDPSVPAPIAIEWLDNVGSTNGEAMNRAAAGAIGPLWIAANRQTGGRGRNGRQWESPAGNLYASLLLTFPRPLLGVPQLSLVAGLATHNAVAKLAPAIAARLKWPNDVLIDGAKLAGILIEGRMAAGSAAHNVVVGIGINLAHHPHIEGRRVTSLAAHGVEAAPAEALRQLAGAFALWLGVWSEGAGMSAIRQAWMSRAVAVGTPVSVNTGPELLGGWFAGLDADGAMLLRLETGGQRRITFGDVHIVAPPGADG